MQACEECGKDKFYFLQVDVGHVGRAHAEFQLVERPCCRVNACEPLVWGEGAWGRRCAGATRRGRDGGLRGGGASVSGPVIGVLSMRE